MRVESNGVAGFSSHCRLKTEEKNHKIDLSENSLIVLNCFIYNNI